MDRTIPIIVEALDAGLLKDKISRTIEAELPDASIAKNRLTGLNLEANTVNIVIDFAKTTLPVLIAVLCQIWIHKDTKKSKNKKDFTLTIELGTGDIDIPIDKHSLEKYITQNDLIKNADHLISIRIKQNS